MPDAVDGGVLSGAAASPFYSPFGFPPDLIEEAAAEQDRRVDREGFLAAPGQHDGNPADGS